MAEFVKLPIESLLKLPDDMPAHIGALIEPLAVAIHGVARAPVQDVTLAAVLGAGPIGILTALVAQASGIPQVVISDVLPSRLELAESVGLKALPAGAPLRDCVLKLSAQNGADLVLECAGHPSSAKEMTSLVRSRGTIVNLGVFKEPVKVDMQTINFKEISMVGSRVYERRDFQAAIELAMELPLQAIISREFPLEDVSDAFKLFRAGDVCKVLILPSGKEQ
jgi:threonine dehydrogenase-like Zn-dependent dehydrogenase